VLRQLDEQTEPHRGQRHLVTTAAQPASGDAEGQTLGAGAQHHHVGRRLVRLRGGLAASYGPDPRGQLFDHDRLDDVVVSTCLEAGDDIGRVAPGAGDDDRHLAGGAHLTDEIAAVGVAEHHVHEQHVRLVPHIGGQALGHVGRLDHLEALLAQCEAEGSPDPVVILDEQGLHGHPPILGGAAVLGVTRPGPSEVVNELSHR
jgi:hypothetical protein